MRRPNEIANDAAGEPAAFDGLPPFRGMTAAGRARLCKAAITHRVPAGTILFEQGAAPNFQHIVIEGSVHLFGRSQGSRGVLIEVVEPPELVIPAAVMTEAPYLMEARIAEDSLLLLIEAATFRAALLQEPGLAQAVILSLSNQFRRMVRQIKNLKLRGAADRVGCYLLALADQQGKRIVLPYEKQLIASMLGITPESFSRALAMLQKHGIAVEGECIAILDREALAAVCRPDPLIDGPADFPATRRTRKPLPLR